jgi:hypothetical protein
LGTTGKEDVIIRVIKNLEIVYGGLETAVRDLRKGPAIEVQAQENGLKKKERGNKIRVYHFT